MKLFFIFLVILLIIFIPIPIKFNIYYSGVNYYIKLYGVTIISQKKVKKKKNLLSKTKPKIKKKIINFSKLFNKVNFKSLEYKPLISKLYHSKFKPILKVNLFVDYSLNDAAKTAIFYGVLCQTPPIIYIILSILFKINKYNFKVNPIFEDKFFLKIETSSIFFLSLANIIYIIIILFKFTKKQGR
ncbi:DUF2953 domain-containing protein [Clostridium sp. C2-6-12]|uniref:DUF2953 domain-containing protein n=1 Tax=Clostridium sp. C2-6-12 TaxID=2698832 RepID=UPI0013680FEE|nr:DUF2953 domain-containing protein [Clostridium sp. C2-6-12]